MVVALQVARDARRRVPTVELALAGQRGQAHHDVRLVLAAPTREAVLGLYGRDHAQVGATLFDRGQVDLEVLAHPVGDDGMAGLVDSHGVTFSFQVLDVLRQPQVLQPFGFEHVSPGDAVVAIAQGHDQRFVDQVLDRGPGGIRRHRGQLVNVRGR